MKLKEEVPVNSVAGGAVAGIGVPNPNLPNQAEPGVDKKNKRKIVPFKNFFRRSVPK